jgi:hypothetical protein
MSEADYMDSVDAASRWDEEHREPVTHEVVGPRDRVMFRGTRAQCWAYREAAGGFVRSAEEHEE